MPLRLLSAATFSIALISSAFAQTYSAAMPVTAADYSDFLNQQAVTDALHFYNDAMGSDPQKACIARVGAPGNYVYEVIAGRESFPVLYVSEMAKKAYCDFTQQNQADIADDLFLASNENDFSVTNNEASLSLTVPSLGNYAYSQWSGTERTLFWAAFGIAVGALVEHIRGKMFDPVAGGIEASSLPRDEVVFKMHQVNELKDKIGNEEGANRELEQKIKKLENDELTLRATGDVVGADAVHEKLVRLRAKDGKEDDERERLRQLAQEKENEITRHLGTISEQKEQIESHALLNHEERKERMRIFGENYKDKKFYHDLFADLESPDWPIYTEADLLEKSIEQNILDGSKSLIESQKYFAEEKRTHELDAVKKYHADDTLPVTRLQAIVEKQKAILGGLKEILLKARKVKQQAYFFGERAATYFLSDERKNDSFDSLSRSLKKTQESFAAVMADMNGHETMTERASVDDHSIDNASDGKSVTAPIVVRWSSFEDQAKSIVDDDAMTREKRKSLSEKDVKAKQAKAAEPVHFSIGSLFNDKQGKRDAAAEKAEAALNEEDAALSRLNQIKTIVEKKHIELAVTFNEATGELSKSWVLLHGIEEQFHSAAWLKLFGEADTGRINIGTETILQKLGLLLAKARRGADEALGDFNNAMDAIQADLHAPTLDETKKADAKVQAAAAVIEKDRPSMEADLALMQQVKALLKQAQDQADVILGNVRGNETTPREQFQKAMEALLQTLEPTAAGV